MLITEAVELLRDSLPQQPPEGWQNVDASKWVKDHWQKSHDLHTALDTLAEAAKC